MLPCVAGVDLKSAKRHQILELEKMWMNFQRELELQNKVIEGATAYGATFGGIHQLVRVLRLFGLHFESDHVILNQYS
ncbi:hypothetical protein Tco_0621047 [Tanacetum coccineum]